MSVRGTNELTDAIVDARAEGVPFATSNGSLCGHAHQGIVEAAEWLLSQVLVPLLGSVTTRVALPYQLTGYALPGAVSQAAHSLLLALKLGQLGRARATAVPSLGPRDPDPHRPEAVRAGEATARQQSATHLR